MTSVRLAHAWSSDLGIPWGVPYNQPLVRRGWSVWNITPRGPRAEQPSPDGAAWLPHRITRGARLDIDCVGAAELLQHFRQHRFHIVHTHATKVGLMGRVLAAIAQTPIIVHTMHGLAYSLETKEPQRALHSSLERIASIRVDAVLAQSREDANTIIRSGAVSPDKVTLVGNGIDLDRFSPNRAAERRTIRHELGLQDSDVLFLAAGRLVRAKGVFDVLEAARSASRTDPRIKLALVGEADREKRDAVTQSNGETPGDPHVRWLGRRNDMPNLYAAADVVVLASDKNATEGWPRVLMEAAAMNKPAITTDVRGCREVVARDETGLIVPPSDHHALTRAMCLLASDSDLRTRLGAAAGARAQSLFDVRRAAEKTAAVYDRLLARKGLPHA